MRVPASARKIPVTILLSCAAHEQKVLGMVTYSQYRKKQNKGYQNPEKITYQS